MSTVTKPIRRRASLRPAIDAGWRRTVTLSRRLPVYVRKRLAGANRQLALANYRRLASDYDSSTTRIEQIQQAAIAALDLRAGDRVLDVACGTGKTLPMLARQVGTGGEVVGVEQSPEMVSIARRRAAPHPQVRLVLAPVEDYNSPLAFDAVLFSFTQDILQNPQAVRRVLASCRPGARIAVAGLRFLPWWWGWSVPVNLFNAVRARRYLTTLANMQAPWRALQIACPDLELKQTWHLGSCYLASGRFHSSAREADWN